MPRLYSSLHVTLNFRLCRSRNEELNTLLPLKNIGRHVKDMDEDRQRAEVFDALAHPTRIRILKALEEETLSFADLKKQMKIESSGHLQHHLSKLRDLIKTDKHGRYCVSEQGKDALFTVQIVENTRGFGGERKKHHTHNAYSPRVRASWNAVIVSLAIVSLVGGFYISNTALSQSRYFCDVVKGTPLYLCGISCEFVIPAGHTFNYTAMVFSALNPPTNYYWYDIVGTFEVPPPVTNSTYYRVGFLGFHIELTASEQNVRDFFTAYFGPATGPNGWNGERVIDPYKAPPYETMPIEPTSITGSDGLGIAHGYIIPITVFGNYTFRIANVGNTTMKAHYKVWTSTVTMKARPLGEDETFPAFTPNTANERVVRIRRQPTSSQFETTLFIIGLPITIATLSAYLINRKI